MKKDSGVHCSLSGANFELLRKAVLKNNKQPMQEIGIIEREVALGNKKTRILEYAYDKVKEIDDSIVEKLSKTMFTVANAYPYIFDAICGLLTNQKKISQKYKENIVNIDDNPRSILFMIDVPFDEFLEWALDENIADQKNGLTKNLIDLAATPPKDLQKYIPISQIHCAKVAPVQIVLIRKNEEEIPVGKLNSLKNLITRKTNKGTPYEKTITLLEKRLPIERIQIYILKSLFQDLLIGEYGEKWFSIPKALQAKIVSFRPMYPQKKLSPYLEKLSKELQKLQEAKEKSYEDLKEYKALKKEYEALKKVEENFPSSMVLRRAYFYVKIHLSSNSNTKIIKVDPLDFFRHVDPSYLRGKNTVGGEERAIAFLDTVYNFFKDLENDNNYSQEHLKPIEIKK